MRAQVNQPERSPGRLRLVSFHRRFRSIGARNELALSTGTRPYPALWDVLNDDVGVNAAILRRLRLALVPTVCVVVALCFTGCASGSSSKAVAHGHIASEHTLSSVPRSTPTTALPAGEPAVQTNLYSVSCATNGHCLAGDGPSQLWYPDV